MERAWSFAGWYCQRGDTLAGPFRPEQIQQLVKAGQLRRSDRVWERWRRGRQSLLFPALASTASARAAPREPRGGRVDGRGASRLESLRLCSPA